MFGDTDGTSNSVMAIYFLALSLIIVLFPFSGYPKGVQKRSMRLKRALEMMLVRCKLGMRRLLIVAAYARPKAEVHINF